MIARPSKNLVGLFELDDSGKVLYSSLEAADGSTVRSDPLEGFNLFADLMEFSNIQAFQQQFDHFRTAKHLTHSFDFTCEYADGPTTVRVLMARLTKAQDQRTFLMHLRPYPH
jgi:hypothetical protein